MLFRSIIIADADIDYLRNLSCRLKDYLPAAEIMICRTKKDVLAALDPTDKDAMIVYNITDFPDLTDWAESFIMDPALLVPLSATGDQVTGYDDQTDQQGRIGRHQPVRKLVRLIESRLSEHEQNARGEAAYKGLFFIFCADSNGSRPGLSRNRLMRLSASCSTVIYLPLMPTYQMQVIKPPGPGVNLSDLLLNLMTGNVVSDHLGHYLEPHPDGFLQFRPPDRSDDLVASDPATLRQLIVQLRNHISQSAGRTSVLIDCAGLPFSTLTAVAVLCDSCEVVLPEGQSYYAQAARKETTRLLAELPAGIQVICSQGGSCDS